MYPWLLGTILLNTIIRKTQVHDFHGTAQVPIGVGSTGRQPCGLSAARSAEEMRPVRFERSEFTGRPQPGPGCTLTVMAYRVDPAPVGTGASGRTT